MMECADILKRAERAGLNFGGKKKQLKNAQGNVHRCTFFCALIKILIMQLPYCRYDQI